MEDIVKDDNTQASADEEKYQYSETTFNKLNDTQVNAVNATTM